MTMPRVCIIVVNWNRRDDTLACLASLQRLDYPAYEVAVVDNHSTDDSAAAVREAFPEAKLFEMDKNAGYVGGNNVGLDYARERGADYGLLLNNDTEVAPDVLRRLVEAAEADPQIGMVGPTIYYFAQPHVVWSAGGAIDWKRGRTWMVGLGEEDQGQWGEQPRPMDFVTGCVLLVKMPVVARIGPLEARFFAYYEDAEWCVRATRAGFKVLHIPSAKVWHKISPEAREASPQVHYYMTRNRLIFLQLTRAGWRPYLYTLFMEYARTLLSWTVKPVWRHKFRQRRAMLKAIADYQRGVWGRVEV